MNLLTDIHANAHWDARSGHSYYSAIDDQQNPVGVNSLRLLLFGWFKESYYGTMLEEASIDGSPMLLLNPWMALRYWTSASTTVHHRKVVWSDEALALQSIARILQTVLINGWFMPALSTEGTVGWGIVWNEELDLSELNPTDQSMLNTWLGAVMRELVLEDQDVKTAWKQIVEAHPAALPLMAPAQLQRDTEWLDIEEWHERIGYKLNDAPCRIGLRLCEPIGTEIWRLQPVLIGTETMDGVYACQPDGSPLMGASLPEGWQAYAERKLSREVEKWRVGLSWFDWELDEEMAWLFLNEGAVVLQEAGWAIYLPEWWNESRKQKPKVFAELSRNAGEQGLFGLDQLVQYDWKLAIGDLEMNEQEFRELLKQKRKMVYMHDRWIPLHPNWINSLRRWLERQGIDAQMRLSEVLELYLLGGREIVDEGKGSEQEQSDKDEAMSGILMDVRLNEHVNALFTELLTQDQNRVVEPPDGLLCVLRHYQLTGLSWLLALRRCGFGACLADDMGLGKTLQFIAYLMVVMQQGWSSGPSLLICPTSVLGNWQKELQRFAPSVKVYTHYGSNRARGEALHTLTSEVDLVLTTYALTLLDEAELVQVKWDVMVLDEAQNIKNPLSKQSTSVRRIPANHRIALTGTPVENRLTELWSIYDYINPGYLGSLRQFQRHYAVDIEKGKNTDKANELSRLVQPFMLRREKRDPAIKLDLPDKNEMKVYIPLTIEQGALYEAELQSMLERLPLLTPMERRGLILATLTRLKRVCDHPALFLREDYSGVKQLTEAWLNRSNKLNRLIEMVSELREQGDKCLIFTQYVEMGRMLERVVQEQCGARPQFLHGGVSKQLRDEMVMRFQDRGPLDKDQRDVFILSLKAGGTGLNLTAANHVFHYDRWWNPAVEEQATDRVYRIGQIRDVQVHKFIALGTLEERIDDMLEMKKELSRQVIGTGEAWITELSTDELRDLFALRREWMEP
ncbi:MAG: DEAD/DEAH box helicase [Paenibacillaceae bacterium]